MLLDDKLIMSDDQAITVTADSTTYADTGAPNAGRGGKIGILIQLEDFAPTTASLAIAVEHCATPDGSYTALMTLPAKTGAGPLAQDERLILPETHLRYIQISYTVASGPFTAGTALAGLDLGNF